MAVKKKTPVTNWQTTLFGFLLSAGLGLSSLPTIKNPTVKDIGAVIAVIGGAGLGLASKDKDVTGGTIHQ